LLLRQAKSLLYLRRLQDAKTTFAAYAESSHDDKTAVTFVSSIDRLLEVPSADERVAKRRVSTQPRYRYQQKHEMTLYVDMVFPMRER
jgi:hypothetical protein